LLWVEGAAGTDEAVEDMKVNFNSDVGKCFAIVTALAPTKSIRSVDGNDTACTEGCACRVVCSDLWSSASRF
jgi:hypothetical protein